MTGFHVLTNAEEQLDIPEIRSIGVGDLIDALGLGWRDFWNKPSHLAFLGLIYPLCGAVLAVWTSGNNSWPLLFPLISGFALVGPFLALPIYEMSRRQELGLDTHWRAAFDVFRTPAFASIAALGVMMLIAFTVWLMAAQFIYETHFGPGSPPTFAASCCRRAGSTRPTPACCSSRTSSRTCASSTSTTTGSRPTGSRRSSTARTRTRA